MSHSRQNPHPSVPSRCARWNGELSADARDRTNRSSAFAARLAMQRMAAYRLSAQLAIRKMKRMSIFLVLSCCLMASCSSQSLQLDPSDITKIRIGTDEKRQDAVVLSNAESIISLLSDFSFGNERDYTVKHPLPGYVEFHSQTGRVAHLVFEDRIMRYNRREYRLSKSTAQMLQNHLKK